MNTPLPPNTTVDDLDADYRILAVLCKTPEEEAKVFDFWIEHNYDTKATIARLGQLRKQTRTRYRREHRSLDTAEEFAGEDSSAGFNSNSSLCCSRRDPVPCVPSDLVVGLTGRQELIWRMRAEGFGYDTIAKSAGCGKTTVYMELDAIQEKLQNS